MEEARRETLPTRVGVIVNRTAGDGLSDLDRVEKAFETAGAACHVVVAENGEDLARRARSMFESGVERIVAAGGDGTVSTVASVLTGSDRVLGVLPLGTLNHFARHAGIPLDPVEAARVAAFGPVAALDVGEVNGRIFLNNSSVGLYPAIVRHREGQQERLGRGKWAALAWATVRVLRRTRTLELRVQAPGAELVSRRGALLFVGNNVYEMEGFRIGRRQRLDGGVLSLYLARATGPFKVLGLALRALVGRLHEGRDFDSLHVTEAHVETRRPHLRVATDGEVTLLATPLHYRIRPGALRLAVPSA